ncbi:MAG: DUF1036 domain-containing protein [Alphaproteobacteria bacterium]|nr:DUF1036 domain-containing protein [Alphaproteobacteria bacterium]
MMAMRFTTLSVLLGMVLLLPAPAKAAFLFCNRTQMPIEAAFGYREEVVWISEGWWQIQPGQCARVFNRPLTQRFYFYYAHIPVASAPADGKPPLTWAGKYRFCIDDKAFRIEGDGNCDVRGYKEKGFREVDIGPNQRNYSLTFEDGHSR